MKPKSIHRKVTPRSARTMDEICRLKRDNLSVDGFWILVEESGVHLAAQEPGMDASVILNIPKRVFNQFVDFYQGSFERTRKQPRLRKPIDPTRQRRAARRAR